MTSYGYQHPHLLKVGMTHITLYSIWVSLDSHTLWANQNLMLREHYKYYSMWMRCKHWQTCMLPVPTDFNYKTQVQISNCWNFKNSKIQALCLSVYETQSHVHEASSVSGSCERSEHSVPSENLLHKGELKRDYSIYSIQEIFSFSYKNVSLKFEKFEKSGNC